MRPCRRRACSTRSTRWRHKDDVQVRLTGALRSAADGCASIEIEAQTIRELITRLVERFPQMAKEVDDGIAVAIDGVINHIRTEAKRTWIRKTG